MKKYFAFGMMVLATLSLANCAKEADYQSKDNAKGDVPFELVASSPFTKTIIDGFNVSWKGGVDQVNVYHAEAGSTTYVNDGSFAIAAADAAAGLFTGTLASAPESGKTYDWYVFYPYIAQKTSPALNNAGFATIGCSASGSQTQNGNNTTAHLSGEAFPLYGIAKGVAFDSTPDVTMHHLASYVEINVTNNSTKPLTVSAIKLDAPQNIVGTYYINFADPSNIKYSSSGNSYVSNSVTLDVTNGAAIPVGESAKFYVGIKPMNITASLGSPQEIKVTVNGYEKTITLTQNVSFVAGKIKTINFNVDQDPPTSTTFVFNTDDGIAELGIAKPATSAGTNLTGPYTKNNVSISFEKSTASNAPRVWNSNGSLDLRIYNHNIITFQAPTGYIIEKIEFSNNGSYTAASGTYSGKSWTGSASEVVLTKGSNTHNINTIQVTCSQQQTVPTITDAVVTGADVHGGTGLTKDIVLSYFDAAPSLTATPDGTVVTAASVDNVTTTGATVTYTLAPNYSSTAAVGTITVSDGAGHEGTISVNQAAAVFTVSRTTIELNANSGSTASFTVNSDFDWTIDDSSLNGFAVTPNSFTYTGNRSQSVTVTSTGDNTTASIKDLDIFCVTRTADAQNSEAITVKQKSAKLDSPTLSIIPDATNKKFTVSWAAVPNATKYVYSVEDKDHNDKISLTETADASTLSFEVTDINLGENYYVSVYAEGNGNPWIDSDVASETVKVNAGSSTETIQLVASDWSLSGATAILTNSVVTIVYDKNSYGSSISGGLQSDHTRFYAGTRVTFTPASGKTVTKLVFTCTTSSYANALTNSTWTNGTPAVSASTVTVDVTTSSSPVSVVLGAQSRVSQVVVTYE